MDLDFDCDDGPSAVRRKRARTVRWMARQLSTTPASAAPMRVPKQLTLNTLRVGSSCSGSMVETMALKEMQCAHCNVFSCDVLESCKTFMTNNFPVQQCLSDVHCPEHAILPPVDLYVAGWCCQPFSLQGRQHGLEDARSDTIWPIITYVQTAKP